MIERLSERYRLEGRLGQGGMAIVYSGMDTVLRRRVAIKVLREQLAADADFVARFYTEAQHAAKLSHPNIVNIYDVGREGETYFIVMELVDGATLAELIEHGRLPEAVAIDFAAQICNGLAYAHRQGLLHRDIKPANILVTKDDVVKLSDFGIARAVTTQTMTQPGMVMGSVFYVSPEQAQGHELHETSDLYSLGIVFYQMLTGKLPYTGESPVTVALKHVSSAVPSVDADDPSISPALAAIVRNLMQKNPADRFASATEVAKALREAREQPTLRTPYDARPSGETRGAAAGVRTIPNPKPRPSKFPDRSFEEATPDATAAPAAGPVPQFWAVAAALCALVVAIVAGYYFTGRAGSFFPPKNVALARLSGETADEAQRRLAAAGLGSAIVPVASEAVAVNRVVKQQPAAGPAVPAGTVVQLFVSTGPPTAQLVDVRQMSSDDAQRFLRGQKLGAKVVPAFNDAKAGTVLSQQPAPGATVPIHTAVTLVVSQGPKPVGIPSIVAASLAAARATLAAQHLRLSVAERAPSDQLPPDTIASQDPAPGTLVPPGSAVSVVVSSGPPRLEVPDVGGRQLDDATDSLRKAGLRVRIVYLEDAGAAVASVMEQDPAAGTPVPKGSSVNLSVAVDGLVPDVGGKSVADAQAILQRDGYKIGNTAYTQEGTEGTVVRTEPAAKSSEHAGATITLYVSGVSPESTP